MQIFRVNIASKTDPIYPKFPLKYFESKGTQMNTSSPFLDPTQFFATLIDWLAGSANINVNVIICNNVRHYQGKSHRIYHKKL